ncbi:MAG: hypothetical protein AAFR38_00500 [Planctomycetota bacterium]
MKRPRGWWLAGVLLFLALGLWRVSAAMPGFRPDRLIQNGLDVREISPLGVSVRVSHLARGRELPFCRGRFLTEEVIVVDTSELLTLTANDLATLEIEWPAGAPRTLLTGMGRREHVISSEIVWTGVAEFAAGVLSALLVLAVVAVGAATLYRRYRIVVRLERNQCIECGYGRAPGATTCPECGAAFVDRLEDLDARGLPD